MPELNYLVQARVCTDMKWPDSDQAPSLVGLSIQWKHSIKQSSNQATRSKPCNETSNSNCQCEQNRKNNRHLFRWIFILLILTKSGFTFSEPLFFIFFYGSDLKHFLRAYLSFFVSNASSSNWITWYQSEKMAAPQSYHKIISAIG